MYVGKPAVDGLRSALFWGRPEELCDRADGVTDGQDRSPVPAELASPLAETRTSRRARARGQDGEVRRLGVTRRVP
jgi:hypothetical protein